MKLYQCNNSTLTSINLAPMFLICARRETSGDAEKRYSSVGIPKEESPPTDKNPSEDKSRQNFKLN